MKQLMIKCNVGPNERKYRFFLGVLAAMGAYFTKRSSVRATLGAVGFAGFATAATRYDPVYHALGINRGQPAYRAFPHLLRRL